MYSLSHYFNLTRSMPLINDLLDYAHSLPLHTTQSCPCTSPRTDFHPGHHHNPAPTNLTSLSTTVSTPLRSPSTLIPWRALNTILPEYQDLREEQDLSHWFTLSLALWQSCFLFTLLLKTGYTSSGGISWSRIYLLLEQWTAHNWGVHPRGTPTGVHRPSTTPILV